MTRKYTFIIAAASALVLSSCSGFLEESNPTGLQDVYSTEKDLEAAVEGVMAGFMYSNGLTGESTEAFPIASGLLHWGQTTQRTDSDKWLSCLNFTQYSKSDWNGYHFRAMFMPVFRANALIAALPSSSASDSCKKEIEAEARFYRAVAYFIMVRIWGDLPIWTEAVDFENAANKERMPYYKVYAQIVEDLKFAEENMRSPARVEEVNANIVRPDKYAATAFLSSVYTTVGSLLYSPDDNFWDASKPGRAPDFSAIGVSSCEDAYTKALAYAESLIPESSTHIAGCNYALLKKFGDLFTYDPAFYRDGYTSFKHPEQVFVLPIGVASDASNQFAQYQLPQYPAGTHASVTNEQYGRIRPSRWAFQKWCFTYPGEWRNSKKYEYKSCGDPRFDDTFYYTYMEYCDSNTVSQKTSLSMYPIDMSYNVRLNAFAYFRKYASPAYNVNSGDSDIYVMRFAEVYFNAIEAAAALGNSSLAEKYMEVIHSRARNSADTPSDMPKWTPGQYTGQALMNQIFWERIFEFFGEDHEYYETHRHGARWIVDNISKPKNEFIEKNLEYYPDAFRTFMINFYPGENFRYTTSVDSVRCALLAGFPVNEILYNSGVSGGGKNDYDFSDL